MRMKTKFGFGFDEPDAGTNRGTTSPAAPSQMVFRKSRRVPISVVTLLSPFCSDLIFYVTGLSRRSAALAEDRKKNISSALCGLRRLKVVLPVLKRKLAAVSNFLPTSFVFTLVGEDVKGKSMGAVMPQLWVAERGTAKLADRAEAPCVTAASCRLYRGFLRFSALACPVKGGLATQDLHCGDKKRRASFAHRLRCNSLP